MKRSSAAVRATSTRTQTGPFAFSVCDDLSYYQTRVKRSGQRLQTIYSAMTSLLVTEGDRRRVCIELGEDEDDGASASVIAIADNKRGLGPVAK